MRKTVKIDYAIKTAFGITLDEVLLEDLYHFSKIKLTNKRKIIKCNKQTDNNNIIAKYMHVRLTNGWSCRGKNPGECSFDKMVCDSQCRSVARIHERRCLSDEHVWRVRVRSGCGEHETNTAVGEYNIILCAFDTGPVIST